MTKAVAAFDVMSRSTTLPRSLPTQSCEYQAFLSSVVPYEVNNARTPLLIWSPYSADQDASLSESFSNYKEHIRDLSPYVSAVQILGTDFHNSWNARHLSNVAVAVFGIGAVASALTHKFFNSTFIGSTTSERAFSASKDVANITAFTNLEAIRANRSQASDTQLVGYLRTASKLQYGERLAARLEELSADFLEDTDGERELSLQSIQNLLSFLEVGAASQVRRPTLAADPQGNLIAEWRESSTRLLSARFLPDGTVKYYAYQPNPIHPKRSDQVSADTTADALLQSLHPSILKWVCA